MLMRVHFVRLCKSYSVNSSLQITKLKVTFDQYYKYLPANILVVL